MSRYRQMPQPADQLMLYGTSVEDALPPDSEVRGFAEVMDCLDYSELECRCSDIGAPPYPPAVMAKVLAYAYSQAVRSSRKIERLLKKDVEFIWLAGGLKPDHNTLARFRRDSKLELVELFKDSVRVCKEAGLVTLRIVAVDGTKVHAAASKRKICGKDRIERELAAVEKVLEEAEETDRIEDEIYGSGRGYEAEMPEHLKDAKVRKQRIEEAAQRLKESKKASVVESDPESRVMRTGEGLRPAYNVQACVERRDAGSGGDEGGAGGARPWAAA